MTLNWLVGTSVLELFDIQKDLSITCVNGGIFPFRLSFWSYIDGWPLGWSELPVITSVRPFKLWLLWPISDMASSDWILQCSGAILLLILADVMDESFCLTINKKK